MAGLKIDRYDSKCALCREAEADKTGNIATLLVYSMYLIITCYSAYSKMVLPEFTPEGCIGIQR